MHALERGQFECALSAQRRLFAILCSLLPDYLAKASDGSNVRVEILLEAVKDLSADTLLAEATPFFWLNVERCAFDALHNGDNINELAEFVLVAAFDSLFDHLPDETTVSFGAAHGCDLVLPNLGVRVPAPVLPARLRRVRAGSLEVTTTSGVLQLSIFTPNRPAPITNPRVAISSNTTAEILLAPSLCLIDPLSALKCLPPSSDITAFKAMLEEALDWIRAVDGALARQMESTIRWYVPIHTDDPRAHRSFTVNGLTGVTFLSESVHYCLLAEGMVHEFYHSVLDIIGQSQDLFGSADPDEKFYSPWRDDPRPLKGLLHAVYVFSGVVNFHARSLATANRPECVAIIEHRLAKLRHQLRIALAQIQGSDLPEMVDRMLQVIEGQIAGQVAVGTNPMIAEMLESHSRDWLARNPDLSLVRVTT